MIKDPYLRKIVEQSGRREITTAMYQLQNPEQYAQSMAAQMAAQQNMSLFAYGSGSQSVGGARGGAVFDYYSKCLYCNK